MLNSSSFYKYRFVLFAFITVHFYANLALIAHPSLSESINYDSYCTYLTHRVNHDLISHQIITNFDHTKRIHQSYGIEDLKCGDIMNIKVDLMNTSSNILQLLLQAELTTVPKPTRIIRLDSFNINKQSYINEIEKIIDIFLMHRIWWKVNLDYSGSYNSNHVVVLERYPDDWTSFLASLSETQYLSSEQCLSTPIIVGRKSGVHPGMSPLFLFFSEAKEIHDSIPMIYYWPHPNSYMSEADCPGNVNKWDCAFLPMTNCSMPRVIRDCYQSKCLEHQSKGLIWSVMVNNASIDGVIIDDAEEYYLDYTSIDQDHDIISSSNRCPALAYTYASEDELHIDHKPAIARVIPFTAIFTFSFMTRPNAFYRPQMQKLLHHMRSKSNPSSSLSSSSSYFHPHTSCVAVHIRRGDRIKVGFNMMEFCANYTHDKVNISDAKRGCVNMEHPHLFGSCPTDASSLGCDSIPFEAIRLKHVISKIPKLISSYANMTPMHDIIVISDDIDFIEDEAKKLLAHDNTSPWRIHTLSLPYNSMNDTLLDHKKTINERYQDRIRHTRYRAGTASGVLFHTSLKVVQQCSAFIGHFESDISGVIYMSMCVHHAGRYGVCPPVYDFQWGLE